MARLTDAEWNLINAELAGNETKYGLPERRDDSLVMTSFNIRKLGRKANRNSKEWAFLANICKRCDLIAVQEVLDNLEGLGHLLELLGDDYGMASSDITGARPGDTGGMPERLAFLFNWKRIKRTEVASDLTFDRSSVIEGLFDQRTDFADDFGKREHDLIEWQEKVAKKLQPWIDGGQVWSKPSTPKKPPFVLQNFVTFIRTPYCVSFRFPADPAPGVEPVEFLAVSAHLMYGDKSLQKEEREMEFQALVEWMVWRAQQADNMYHPNMILFGDLNLDFREVDERKIVIEEFLVGLNNAFLNEPGSARINFPFLDVHPDESEVFRSTARLTETYDQVAFVATDPRLPMSGANATAGNVPDGFDYGVFNFSDLFANALHGTDFHDLDNDTKQALVRKYEHKISDHLPIWIRLPKPS